MGCTTCLGLIGGPKAARAAKMSAIVSVSELVRLQYLAGNPGFPSARIVTIPNGVDEERRRGGDRAKARHRLEVHEEYLFVSLSRHCLQKNTYGLLTAFSDLARHHPGAHLVVAGKLGPDPRYSRRVLRIRVTASPAATGSICGATWRIPPHCWPQPMALYSIHSSKAGLWLPWRRCSRACRW